MKPYHGQFVWYDLMVAGSAEVAAFYRAVAGWEATDSGLTDRHYTILSAASVPVGGLLEAPPGRDAAPSWNGYIGVEDVDGCAVQVTAGGGTIHRPAEDIPGVGRFAIVADPQGATFALFAPVDRPAPPPVAARHGGPCRLARVGQQ